MRSHIHALAAGAALLSLAVSPVLAAPTVVIFDAPGAGTQSGFGTSPGGINLKGEVAGTIIDNEGSLGGFVRKADGTYLNIQTADSITAYSISKSSKFTGQYSLDAAQAYVGSKKGKTKPFAVPGADFTIAFAIGDNDDTTGWFTEAPAHVRRGFVRDAKGHVQLFDAPNAAKGTTPEAINISGDAVGYFVDANLVQHGFVRLAGGTLTPFDAPGAGSGVNQGTKAYGVGVNGTIAGYYIDAGGVLHGFLRDADGTMHVFDVEGAGTGVGQGTRPRTMSPKGVITGWYIDAGGVSHGFLRNARGKITKFDIQGAGTASGQGTIPVGINADNVVTGDFIDAGGVLHGFIRTP